MYADDAPFRPPGPSLLVPTAHGLYCPGGDFFVDPWRPLAGSRAIITHAHSDHARWGAGTYLTSAPGRALVQARLGACQVDGLAYGQVLTLGSTRVSLVPAGHILGSAMIRIEQAGRVWVFSGDYKTQRDCGGELIDPPRCDVFITESTFGLPIYRWKPREAVVEEMRRWWQGNASEGHTSIIYAYSLGKAQSVLAGMLGCNIGPLLVHGAVERFVSLYEEAGVTMPRVQRADAANVKQAQGTALVIAPPSADGSPWARKFGSTREALASGWMQVRGTRRRRNVDRGFVLSDHADWPGLLRIIQHTGAEAVGVTHGFTHVLARWLCEHGTPAWSLSTQYQGEVDSNPDDDADADPGGAPHEIVGTERPDAHADVPREVTPPDAVGGGAA